MAELKKNYASFKIFRPSENEGRGSKMIKLLDIFRTAWFAVRSPDEFRQFLVRTQITNFTYGQGLWSLVVI